MKRLVSVLFVCLLGVLSFNARAYACASNEIDVLGDGTNCQTSKFEVTTTSDTTSLVWGISTRGTWYVDCGDGGTLTQSGTSTNGSTISNNTTITRTSLISGPEKINYTCTWDNAGAHTIRFGGASDGNYSTYSAISFYRSGGTQDKIASIDGSLAELFPMVSGNNCPRFIDTFRGTAITSIPTGLFSGINTSLCQNFDSMFKNTFYDCAGLTGQIPAELFSTIDTSSATNTSNMFSGTFYVCTGLTSIPTGLFSDIDTSSSTNTNSMFYSTFKGCTGLTGQIPTDLFSDVDTSSATNTSGMFRETFNGCTSLTSIPTGLFSSVDTSSATNTSNMFYETFRGCTSLTSIPTGLFSSVDTSSATNTGEMFRSTFYGCTGITGGIPTGLFSGVDTSAATATNSMFNGTFYGCTSLTSIPTGLFNGIDTSSATNTSGMFSGTFNGCTSLTSIPTGLFSSVDTSSATNTSNMFYETFKGCANLSGGIPAGLFNGVDTSSATNTSGMFNGTFNGCANLSGYISATAFPPTIVPGSTSSSNMWADVFKNTQLATACPSNTIPVTTGYEANWGGKVACTTCPVGRYDNNGICATCTNSAPQHATFGGSITATCPWKCDIGYSENNGQCETITCSGATYFNPLTNSCVACPTGYTDNVTNGKTDVSQCQRSCAAGTFIATPATVGSTDYTRLEFIENPDGYYINTGFTHSTTATKIRGVLRVGVSTDLSNKSNVNFIGNQASGGGYSVGWNAYFKLWTVSSNNRLEGPAYPMTAGTVHQIEYEVTNSTRKLVYDDGREKSDTFSGGKILSPATTIHLFDAGNNQAARSFKGRIYDLQVYEDDVLVHNFVAARRNSDGVVGIYDIKTDTFKSGTGTFTAGPDAGACSDVGVGYYSSASLTNYGSVGSRVLCTNGAAHSHYTASATSNSCPFVCDDNYVMENGVCEFQDKFTLTTTSNTTELLFDISAVGTFYVDCGTDGLLTQTAYSGDNNAAGTVITRTNTTNMTYSCAWPTAGVHTVKFAGTATSYNTGATTPAIAFYRGSNNTSNKIASISGSLATIFPQKGTTNGKFPRFYQTFRGATNLTSIPAGLFTGLDPGANATKMFYQTFYGCSGVSAIPAGLFASITTGATEMFRETFSNCTSLTAIPSDLFSNVTTAATGLFQTTFKGATNLSSYIPPTTFAGLIANSSPTATDMWTGTFDNTNVATACPTGMDEYPSGYESAWSPRVSCYVACPDTPPANSEWFVVDGVCQWLCDAMYYSANGTSCTAVETGYYSAAADNAQTACTNKPANSHYTGSAATNDCPWQCDTGYGSENGSCRACTVSEYWADGVCETAKFTITTTNSTGEFKFFMWGSTGTFYVDWGDGTVDTITRASSTGNTYSHSYATTGSYTIRFGGGATGYDGNSAHTAISFYSQTSGTQDKIASVSGSLVALFPTPNDSALPYFRETFKGATNLHSVPNTLFSGITRIHGHMFYHTFDGSGLSAIPADLFDDVDSLGPGMFEYTFANCASLTAIPSGLFDDMIASGAADDMFEGTFAGCTSLATIPSDLFEDVISNAANGTDETGWFKDTFNGCTGLQSIPAELFSGITAAAESLFSGTFYGCTNLAGYIPPSTFAGLISNDSPTAEDMWSNTFSGTSLITMCPAGMAQYITEYEGSINGTTWNGKVSCEPCATGTYKASAGNTACTACEIGTYAATTAATSCTACTNTKPANSVYTSNAVTNACLWACGAGYYSTDNISCIAVGSEYYSAAGDNTRTACSNGLTTIGYGHGADEAGDCGRALTIGQYLIHARSARQTTPSLNFKTSDNQLFYVSLTTDHTLSPLHLGGGGNEYTAYDDSLYHNERPTQ